MLDFSGLWLGRLLVAVGVVFDIIKDIDVILQIVLEHEQKMKEKIGSETEGEVAE